MPDARQKPAWLLGAGESVTHSSFAQAPALDATGVGIAARAAFEPAGIKRTDAGLAALLRLPASPLARWQHWQRWRRERPRQAGWLRLLLATGLRESVEEMRLNPFGVTFLGPLPAQSLIMFNRVIYPMVVWVSDQKRFYPNWEVEKIVYIPVCDLFDPAKYARYCLQIQNSSAGDTVNTFPCFRHQRAGEAEILWGATYRITVGFLKRVFDFEPPDMHSLPEIHGHLGKSYLSRAS